MGDWCTIESDPGVFTELIQKFGVQNVQMRELCDLDELKHMNAYGLIFLFKYRDEKDPREVARDPPGVFFAKQVINNACATQAIINILMNRQEITLGPVLENYKGFAECMDPDIRGLALSNSDPIRIIHNSFARPEPFQFESAVATKDDDVYHFVAYVPVGGAVYELDGLKEGPIPLGAYTGSDWTEVAKPALQARMTKYANANFALQAMVESPIVVKQRRLAEVQAEKKRLQTGEAMDTDAPVDVEARLTALAQEEVTLEQGIVDETQRSKKWEEENLRRRHNYVPFLFNLFKTLAAKGKLEEIVEQARKKDQERATKAAADKTSS